MVEGVPHFLSEAAGEHLRELLDSFELVWCTGWEEKADAYLPVALSLPQGLPFLTFAGRPVTEAHWKLAAIDEFAGPDRALAWIDDAHSADCHEWAAARPAPTLLVRTDPAHGLTADEAAILRSWAAERRAQPGRESEAGSTSRAQSARFQPGTGASASGSGT